MGALARLWTGHGLDEKSIFRSSTRLSGGQTETACKSAALVTGPLWISFLISPLVLITQLFFRPKSGGQESDGGRPGRDRVVITSKRSASLADAFFESENTLALSFGRKSTGLASFGSRPGFGGRAQTNDDDRKNRCRPTGRSIQNSIEFNLSEFQFFKF